MLRGTALPLATAAAGLIAGPSAATFLAAAAAAAAAAWLLKPGDAADGFVTLDPRRPDAAAVMQALREAVRLARSRSGPVRLRISALPPGCRSAPQLDVSRDADLVLAGSTPKAKLGLPGVWIPDHPLPLALRPAQALTLRLEPCAGGRVRATAEGGRCLPPAAWLALAGAAAGACLLDAGWLLAASLGFAFHARLLQQEPGRAPQDAGV